MVSESVTLALRQVAEALASLNVPSALAGGLGLAAWNHFRATRDVDLLVSVDEIELADVRRQLIAAGFKAKHDEPVEVGSQRIAQFTFEPPETFLDIQIDLLLAKTDYQRRALERRQSQTLETADAEIAVLSCEDLILFKLLAGRLIDRADAVALIELNREEIDFELLRGEASHLKLNAELDVILGEAGMME